MVKNPPANAEDTGDSGLIPGSGSSSGGGNGNPLFLLEKSHGQSSLVDYSPRGHKESDRTERLRAHAWTVREVLLAVLSAFHISSHLISPIQPFSQALLSLSFCRSRN